MPANAKSTNRRKRRANLLRSNKSLTNNYTLYLRNPENKNWREFLLEKTRKKWPRNLLPFFNKNLLQKLNLAYKNIGANVAEAKRIENAKRQWKLKQQAERIRTSSPEYLAAQAAGNRRRLEEAFRRSNQQANMFSRTGFSF